MRPAYSAQYESGVVVIEERDFPIDWDNFVDKAQDFEATKEDTEPGAKGELYVVRLQGREFNEIYTTAAMRRTINILNKEHAAAKRV